MAQTVLVTGACGFLAPYIIRELRDNGFLVRATDLPHADWTPCADLDCDVRYADLLHLDQALEVMDGVDMVVHTAARMNYHLDRASFELANYNVTVNACEAALRRGVERFVHFSTCDTYGPPLYAPVDEDHPQRPINLYAITKLYGEQAAFRYHRDRGLPLSVIRPTTVYGPGCVYVMGLFLALPVMVRELGVRRVALPRKGFLGNLVHAEDIAGATVHVMRSGEALGRAFNVSDDSPLCAGELIETILDSIGIQGFRVLPVSDTLVRLGSRLGAHLPRVLFAHLNEFLQRRWDRVVFEHGLVPMLKPRFDPGFMAFGRGDYHFDNSRLKSLGYVLRHPDFKKGWNETVRWYAGQGWIPDYSGQARPE
ncbi:MAG: SDR family oxidoreductase [Actinomycetota bacterium]